MTNLNVFLKRMTELALEFDVIVAEPIESVEQTYNPEFGTKLYWDSQTSSYVAKLPSGDVVTIQN